MSKIRDRFTPKIDLRKEMIDLVSETQFEVLVQRTSQKIRCDCYNELFQEADAKCPKCVGTGWLFKFEKHKCFKQDIISTNNGDIIVTPSGQLVSGYVKFFFPYDTPIAINDYIWEVAFKSGKPIKLINLYKIGELSEQRGVNGSVEFKIIIAQNEPFNKDFKNMYVGKAWRDIT